MRGRRSPLSPKRETFTTSWGAVLSTAGVAIGLGNIWRFPYMMGMFGGGSFLALYLLIILAFGVPGLMAEWALGRYTRRGPVGAFERIGMPGGSRWGYLLLATVWMAGAYYAVVIAWVFYYFVRFGSSAEMDWVQEGLSGLTGSFSTQWICLVITVALACVALSSGVRRGIERSSRIILPAFFLLFLVLVVRILTLPGTYQGLQRYLLPHWSQVTPGTFLGALGQAFFSLGLGGTFMLIYGSYLDEGQDIPRNALWTAATDVAASLLAGLIVVPSVVAFGLDMSSGPPLMFMVMPQVFSKLPLGFFFGALFFLSVFLVAMLSLIAGYEVLVAALEDRWGWSRSRAVLWVGLSQIVLAVPSMLSMKYLLYSDLVWGSTMQPLGGALAVVALFWCRSRVEVMENIGRNTRLPLPQWLYYWIKYVVPLGIVTTLLYGWLG